MNIFQCIVALVLFLAGNLNASTLQGKVVHVADGDTITVLDATNTQHKIACKALTRQGRLRHLDKSENSLCIN